AELFMTVAQTAMDKGDPTNYARFSADKQVMLLQAMEDETMPPKATESLGRAMGLPQIAPVFAAIDGVETIAAPAGRRGWAQYSPARPSLAYAPENAPDTYAASRARLFHFISTWAKTGVGEIR